MSTKSLLPVPIFHDDHLSHSFKHATAAAANANDSFRQRQRPPKLYPKHTLHHHHYHNHSLNGLANSSSNGSLLHAANGTSTTASSLGTPSSHAHSLPATVTSHNAHSAHMHSTTHTLSFNGQHPGQQHQQHQHSNQHHHHLHHHSNGHQHHHHHHHHHSDQTSVFNKSMSCSSVATSVSFNQNTNPAFSAATPPLCVCTQRPLTSPHYDPTGPDSYFEQCFEVLARLGEGSFSEVFRVRSRDDGHQYAVKRSKQPYRSERWREERLEEVRRYEQLASDPHCLRLYMAWEQDDHLYIKLELCRESLDAFVLRQPEKLQEPAIWPLLADLLLALRALHARDLIHLDVKLENVMMTADGGCKLGDFGLVVDLNKPNLHQSCEGDSRYIAPELLHSRFTKAADVFSFGISALELVCNLTLPNNGPLWVQLRNGELPAVLREASEEMQAMITAAMRPEWAERPAVEELLRCEKIEEVLRRRRRWLPVRKVTREWPRRAARVGKKVFWGVKRLACVWWLRLVAMLWIGGGGAGRLPGRTPMPQTPRHREAATAGAFVEATPQHRSAISVIQPTPLLGNRSQNFGARLPPQTPSSGQGSPMLPHHRASTSTPSWRAGAHVSDDGDFVFGRSPRLNGGAGGGGGGSMMMGLMTMTPSRSSSAAEQLLQLDDSEIEGSPPAKGRQGVQMLQTPCRPIGSAAMGGGGGMGALANSTPLTTHQHHSGHHSMMMMVGGSGGGGMSRRETSALQKSLHNSFNDSNQNHSDYMDGTSPMGGCGSANGSLKAAGCTKRKKLFCNNMDDSD